MSKFKIPLWILVFGYIVCWVPYIAITRGITHMAPWGMDRPLTGLEILPVQNIFILIIIFAFFAAVGWWKAAHHSNIMGMSLPRPTLWTALAGVGSALIVTTVPLALTFPGVSIPFIQVIMRGDVLLVAPLVDKISGRKVHWYSWLAVALVILSLVVTIQQRGGLKMPILCIVTIIIYTIGYFIRLVVMTRISKTSDTELQKRYFVEEQMVAYPVALLLLATVAWAGHSSGMLQLRWGFIDMWGSPALLNIFPLGAMTAVIAVIAAFILLDKRENTFCVPLERSAAIIGGVMAAYVLAWMYGFPLPTNAELVGVGILILAIVVLSFGPKMDSKLKDRQLKKENNIKGQ